MIILIVIGLIAGLVLVHELGHFIAAKLFKVQVLELGIGFPPRLFSFSYKGTKYSLNLIPLGGYVKLLGEDDPQVLGGLASKSAPARLMVLGAGSFMNAVLPLLLLTISFMLPRQVMVSEVRIAKVALGSPAQEAGLLPGDRIISVNQEVILNPYDLKYQVQLNLGKLTTLEIERGGQRLFTSVVPRPNPPPMEGPLGIIMAQPSSFSVIKMSYPPKEAFINGLRAIRDTGILLREVFHNWLAGGQAPGIGGPVAIVQMTAEVAQWGPVPLLIFAAFLSLNLAIFNLLPLPALDGGRIFFTLIEGIRRKRLSPDWQRRVHLLGFVFLLTLILLVTYFDLLRIFRGERFIP